MQWLILSLISAALLGVYDVFKKASVRDNAVPIVLLCSCSVAAAIWAPMVLASALYPQSLQGHLLFVPSLTVAQHLLLFGKAAMVGASWTCAFFALKHLPLTVAAPIRATAPLWTISVAILLLGERPSEWQWLGIALVLASFAAFTLLGRVSGVALHRNRYVGLMVVATLIGAGCGIYDKLLLQTWQLTPAAVQAWFSIYLVPVMLPLSVHWYLYLRRRVLFEFRRTIPLIAISLLAADFAYFSAVSMEGALISVISPLRRTSVLIAFVAGRQIFREQDLRAKAICTVGMVLGVWLLSWQG